MKVDPHSNPRQSHQGIWILAEAHQGRLLDVSLELLGSAARLAAQRPQPVWAVLFGHGVEPLIPTLWEHGADTVLAVDDPALGWFNDEEQAALLGRLLRQHRPEILLAGASAVGRALAPRVAVAESCGLTADCTGLEIDPASGALLQTRPAFGGSLMATIRSDAFLPQMATVRPGVMKRLDPVPGRRGGLVRESLRPEERRGLKQLLEWLPSSGGEEGFGNASFIITGGRGMRGAEGFELLRRFAAKVGGAVGATRAAVDAGWAPYAIQIGQTGRTVQPRIYLACGVSGQIQHLVGMQGSDLIIAINPDPAAPIMAMADIAIVGDAFAILPELIALIQP
ncbi:MAG: electron transfer flavoprotein subunit alpha/FixB family protein [Lentisphaeria bacterium]|jgi:electron transfer flavoprotein alpha subunit